ncbi:MAG: hydrogenase [Lentisphaerae bacterium]|jgi:hydrogenase-4 component E|nr:hydrogenase [Lentisphaerota bacterium]
MQDWMGNVLIALILTDLLLLGSSQLRNAIRLMAVQGFVLGLLPWLAHGKLTGAALLMGATSAVLKGGVFPALLRWASREIHVRREIEPLVGYIPSLLIGLGVLTGAFVAGARLTLPWASPSPLLIPTGLFTAWTGLFLIMARRKALTQVLGYIVLENGIFILGMVVVEAMPLLVELGVLLDVFAGVFVMGILVFHINREFSHIDVDQLDALREETL